ncbi:hypothetical protein [Polycladidibacter hongkongensis]|uniref:hypothetical protein n=1 Tax=Polycladidibacter hongkongensis TaxID=1647556 RepID=UPI000829967B|nr:hypothetical protein [Pseudovibrio hongkongensis]
MNIPMIIAAFILIATALIHALAGGQEYLIPMMDASISVDNEAEQKALYAVVWHAITALFSVGGVALLIACYARSGVRAIAWLYTAQLFCFSSLFLWQGYTWLGEVYSLPQWALFGLNLLFLLWGIRQERPNRNRTTSSASSAVANP